MELITLLALLVPSAEPPGALSQVPPTRCASLCTPIHAFAKDAHLFSPGSSSPCQHLPGYLHWDGTKHLKLSTSPLSSPPFSPTCHFPPAPSSPSQGLALSSTRLPKARTQCPSTFTHVATTRSWFGLLEFSFIFSPFSTLWPRFQDGSLLSSL